MSKSDLKMKSNADKVIANLKKMTPIAEKEGTVMANDSLAEICQLTVSMAPIRPGNPRRSYRIIKTKKLLSNRIVGTLINNEKCFRYVSDDHRIKNGGFIKGGSILQKPNKLANATCIPKRFKQMATTIVKKG